MSDSPNDEFNGNDDNNEDVDSFNMNNTVLNTFSQGVALFLSQSIFPLISQQLANRGVSVSVDELMALISTPQTGNNQPISAPFTGSVAPVMVTRKVGNNNNNNNNETQCVGSQNPLPGKCNYRFKRGDNKGLFCTRPMAPGSIYCTNCVKTRKNLSKDTGIVPGVAPNTVVQGYTVPEPQAAQLNVVVFDPERNLYRELNYNFIVHQQTDGIIAVLGRLSDDGQTFVPLSETEREIAKSLGLKDDSE